MAIKPPIIRSAQISSVNGNGDGDAESLSLPKPSRLVTRGKAPGFVRVRSESKRRIIVNIEGEEKSGKNHMGFSYTGGPIYLHSFDIGDEGVVDKFVEGGEYWYKGRPEVYVAEYALEVQPGEASAKAVAESAGKLWDGFVANYKDSIESTRDNDGLVLCDTGTEMWELLRLASFGKLTQVMPHHYGPVNAEFRDLIRFAYEGSNVAFLHKLVDEWENYTGSDGKEKGRKTGNKTRKGFSDMPFLVQANVMCWREDREGGGSDFFAQVRDCRQNPDLNNVVINNSLDELLSLAVK